MSVTFSDLGFTPPHLSVPQGVAGLDMATMGHTMAILSQTWNADLHLPLMGALRAPEVFQNLTALVFGVGRQVLSVIDLRSLTWAMGQSQIRAATLRDYFGGARQAMAFTNLALAERNQVTYGRIPMALPSGAAALLWLAQLPPEAAEPADIYGLFGLAGNLAAQFDPGSTQVVGRVAAPVLEIRFERVMSEIDSLNQATDLELHQRIILALDHTGTWVDQPFWWAGQPWETTTVADSTFAFGETGPVLSWFTAPDSTVPVALVLTTAQAWLPA